ncbi:hypothetical protein [Streptomyces olivaceoviridis]|uniref:hypothetical protein n=1 Tax=Streptomyces olivaceoviridis TaxID=1921 RepID=UPI0036FC082B
MPGGWSKAAPGRASNGTRNRPGCGLFAAVCLVAYTAYGAPVLVAGIASDFVPLTATVAGYGLVVALLAASAVLPLALRSRRDDRARLAQVVRQAAGTCTEPVTEPEHPGNAFPAAPGDTTAHTCRTRARAADVRRAAG